MKRLIGLTMVIALVAVAHSSYAQQGGQLPTRIVANVAAPIYIQPDAKLVPLRTAAAGSMLNVQMSEGGWYRVEFQDPQFGRRIGYIERRHVSPEMPPSQQAVDLSVAESTPAPLASKAQEQQSNLHAAQQTQVYAQGNATLYIIPGGDGFETYVAAAVIKKRVPVTVVTKEEGATYILKAAKVEIQQQSTGSKFARCLFAYCNGIEDRGAVSVTLMKGDAIVWSYSVNKGRGQKNLQSLAEAVAKHMKDEVFSD